MIPIIGIVARKSVGELFENVTLHQEYIDAVLKFGGDPLLLVCGSIWNHREKMRLLQWLKKCDGVVITGGEQPTDLDYYILDYCIKHNVSVLGICLGMQVMGTYLNKNKLVLIGNNEHCQADKQYVHEVGIEKNSKLGFYLEKEIISVNSRHIEKIEDGGIFKVVGKSNDGIIEAIENIHHPFQIGVQWHPESMVSYDENSRKLWKAFIKQCKKNKE